MANSGKESKAGFITGMIIIWLCLLGIIALVISDIVSRILSGWTNSDTIQSVFTLIVGIFGFVMVVSFQNYLININKKVLFWKNDIFRLFLLMEENRTIDKYEKYLIDIENNRRLIKINKIIHKKDKTISIDMDNLNDYFDAKYEVYKKEINIISSIRLSSLYAAIMLNKSKTYEKMYASIHSGEYIKEPKFPLFEFIIPLLIGVIGIFVTLYETLSINGVINEPLINYLKLFGATFLFVIEYSILTLRSRTDDTIERYQSILNKLNAIVEQ